MLLGIVAIDVRSLPERSVASVGEQLAVAAPVGYGAQGRFGRFIAQVVFDLLQNRCAGA